MPLKSGSKVELRMKHQAVEVLWVARYDYPPGWRMNIPHEHDYYQIIYNFDGKAVFRLDPDIYEVAPDRFFIIRPFRMHQLFCDAKTGAKTLDIKFLVHDQQLRDHLNAIGPETDTPGLEVQAVFKKIREEGREKRDFYKELTHLYLEQMLYLIVRIHQAGLARKAEAAEEPAADETHDACQKVKAYIKAHYHEELNLKAIAAEVGYNQSYICQIFKRKMNNTPIGYLYSYRLKKAKELITFSDYSLKQIATMTGFKNVHHFTRIFHQIEGATPGQWRKTEKEGISKGVFINEQFTNKNFLKEMRQPPGLSGPGRP